MYFISSLRFIAPIASIERRLECSIEYGEQLSLIPSEGKRKENKKRHAAQVHIHIDIFILPRTAPEFTLVDTQVKKGSLQLLQQQKLNKKEQ